MVYPISTSASTLELMADIVAAFVTKNHVGTAELPKLIEQANRSLGRVSVLIEDLLNTTKLSEGQLALKKSVFNISQLIDNCCNDIRMEYDALNRMYRRILPAVRYSARREGMVQRPAWSSWIPRSVPQLNNVKIRSRKC